MSYNHYQDNSFIMDLLVYILYLIGQLYYYSTLDKNYVYHKIWSRHETFHLFIVVATLGLLIMHFK